MKPIFAILASLLGVTLAFVPSTSGGSEAPESGRKIFENTADQALAAMSKRAEQLKIQGAAVVAYVEGEKTTAWSSRMVIVGSMKQAPSANNRGVNLIAIAYSKAAEMADTFKDSGSGLRPPMTGEFGWQGGLITKVKTGYLIAAFSGGPSADDLKVARVGLDFLAAKL